jgi:hypothetical protein
VNEKNQVTKKRLYSEVQKRKRTSGITKEVAGHQKGSDKSRKQSQASSLAYLGRRSGSQRCKHKAR